MQQKRSTIRSTTPRIGITTERAILVPPRATAAVVTGLPSASSRNTTFGPCRRRPTVLSNPGDPEACDPLTTFYICYRPVFLAGPSGSKISPNLAGRLTADFALCYQLNQTTRPALAIQCLKNAVDIFQLADTSFPDPAPAVGSGSCGNCLLTVLPFDGYPENVWDDDMELGASELYFAL